MLQAHLDFTELDIFCWSLKKNPICSYNPKHIPTPLPNPTHKLSLKSEGNER